MRAIDWTPLNRFATGVKQFAESEATKKREQALTHVKILSEMRKAGYTSADMQDMAIDIEGFGKFTPLKEMTDTEKSYNKRRGVLEANKDFPVPPQPTVTEREMIARKQATFTLVEMAKEDPNFVYSHHGFRMNDDGTLYLDPVHQAPVKLKSFPDVLGKRTNIDVIRKLGEQRDDALQVFNLLQDPDVKAALGASTKETGKGFWDTSTNKVSNSFRLWAQKKGFGKASKVGELITRIQRFASQERKEFLGVAVTGTELESVLSWMPSAGDSFEEIWTKSRIAASEAEQQFVRFLDMYKNEANMGPVYDAFGIKRFNHEVLNPPITPPTQGRSNPPPTSGFPIGYRAPGRDAQGNQITAIYKGKDEEGEDVWETE